MRFLFIWKSKVTDHTKVVVWIYNKKYLGQGFLYFCFSTLSFALAISNFFHSTHCHSFIEVIWVRIGKTLHLYSPSNLSLRMKNLVGNQVHFQEAVTSRKSFFTPTSGSRDLRKPKSRKHNYYLLLLWLPLPRFLENIPMSIGRTWFDKHIPEHIRGKALIAVLVQTFNGNKTCLEF